MLRRLGLILSGGLLTVGLSAFAGCDKSSTDDGTDTCAGPAATASTDGREWTGFHIEVPLDPKDFDALASGLFGDGAQGGKFIKDKALTNTIFLSSSAESATPQQTRLTFDFNDGKNPHRTLAVAPASFALGKVFITTVDAALATVASEEKAQPGSSSTEFLEYRVTSPMGGVLSFGVRTGGGPATTLVVDVTSPHTSLNPAKIGQPAMDSTPYDSVAGTVWFGMTRDDFSFFANHAYGSDSTSKQNFTDFVLIPHNWLHLTVTPHLDQQFVQVAFDVIANDGSRIPVAQAPASVLAGDTFLHLVLSNMDTMTAQEAAKPGSSTPWTTPFYYDQPTGGGVVQVIAQGAAGNFSVAYAVETPHNQLTDVPFAAYEQVKVTPVSDDDTASCDKLGDKSIVLAPKGTFNITFSASETILNSKELMGPLKGDIYCSVYRAEDVTVAGPKDGAKSLQDFQLKDADLQSKTAPTFVTNAFFDGDYQILCFQDLDKSGGPTKGDPVTLPIGSFPIACNKNPTAVQFAILDPENE